jgi:hypothetical protein
MEKEEQKKKIIYFIKKCKTIPYLRRKKVKFLSALESDNKMFLVAEVTL